MEVIPAILTDNPAELKELVSRAEEYFEKVQIDIIDGYFAENKTILPDAMKYVETNLKIDFHLMVKDPVNWVEKCAIGGGDRIIGQIEMMESQEEFIKAAQAVGAGVGLALDVKTSIESVHEDLLSSIDVILLMSVPAGYGGQDFDPSVFEKIDKVRKTKIQGGYNFRIRVDGGINFDNIRKVMENGSDEVSIGRGLFKNDISKNVKEIGKILKI